MGECICLTYGVVIADSVWETSDSTTNMARCSNLYELLWKLHEKRVIHGDPCLQNVILDGDKHLWIDLMELKQASSLWQSRDAELLTWLILGASSKVVLDNVLVQLIKQYATLSTLENISHLSTEVCARLGPRFSLQS